MSKVEVTDKFVKKWARSIQEGIEKHETIPFWQAVMHVQQLLREAGVDVIESASKQEEDWDKVRDKYSGDREDE